MAGIKDSILNEDGNGINHDSVPSELRPANDLVGVDDLISSQPPGLGPRLSCPTNDLVDDDNGSISDLIPSQPPRLGSHRSHSADDDDNGISSFLFPLLFLALHPIFTLRKFHSLSHLDLLQSHNCVRLFSVVTQFAEITTVCEHCFLKNRRVYPLYGRTLPGTVSANVRREHVTVFWFVKGSWLILVQSE